MTNDIEKVRQLTSEIDGWLSDSEGKLLYKLAKKVPNGQAIVEIGSWKGKSTVWLAKGTEAGQRNKVHSVDSHSGSKAHISEGETNTYPAFINNLTKAGVQDIVVPLVKTSAEAVKRWREGIGLLWIDAIHEYEDVKCDFLSWEPHLLPGARVAFHGCAGEKGVAYKTFNGWTARAKQRGSQWFHLKVWSAAMVRQPRLLLPMAMFALRGSCGGHPQLGQT